jgi:predicted unusual protein kinase regulating ubiquinone biosynthesis (AarF/ABC1/UbiB family)
MNYISTFYRYMSGNNEGMVGKINQHNDVFVENMKDVPKANEIISESLISKLDDDEIIAKHRGSMGIIYVGHYGGKKISIKVVPKNIKNIIDDETSILDFAQLFGVLNTSIVKISEDLQLRIKNELRMDLERENYSLMDNHPKIKLFGGRTVKIIDNLCDSDHLVYEYENCDTIDKYIVSLSEEKRIDICDRIISIYFQLQKDDIFVGDVNSGNFLYDMEKDEIVLIDYGCIIRTTEKFRKSMEILMFHFLHSKDTDYLTEKFCNGSRKCKKLLDQIQRLMDDKETDFSDLQLDFVIFDFDAISGSNFLPQTLTVLRSLSHLLLLAKKMKIKTNIRSHIEKNVTFDLDLEKYRPDDISDLLD